MVLRISSCQAEIAEPFCAALAGYLGAKLAVPVEHVCDIGWQERERRFLRGEIHVSWICGLAYVRQRLMAESATQLLAAPVRSHARYAGRPEYCSDVVVHAASGMEDFTGLRGATWGFNEQGSHSGYNVMRHHLASQALGADYFGRVVESGSHRNSLRMIVQRAIDAAAIDSTVLELELAKEPALAGQIRTIATLGPSPAPPWVVHGSVAAELQQALRRELLAMDQDAQGRRILAEGRMLRFAPVSDADYDAIRAMDRSAASIAPW